MDIDFSDMLSDPDFVEPFTVTRREAVVFGDDRGFHPAGDAERT